MKSRRIKELLAILTIGDGVVALLFPGGHARLWKMGPEWLQRSTEWVAAHPNLLRLMSLSQIAWGVWLALQQHRPGE